MGDEKVVCARCGKTAGKGWFALDEVFFTKVGDIYYCPDCVETISNERKKLAAEQVEKERVAQIEAEKRDQINALKNSGNDGYWEYATISMYDEQGFFNPESGKVNIVKMTERLNEMGRSGWRLVTAYSNELGKNMLSGGVGGIGLGVNSTVDEHILIFERFIKI